MPEVVFVSYARADHPWVEPLVQAVRRQGHVVYYDAHVIGDGDVISASIRKAIPKTTVAVMCRSAVADERPWVRAERDAFERAGAKILEATQGDSPENLLAAISAARSTSAARPNVIVLAAAADAIRGAEIERALGVLPLPMDVNRVSLLSRALSDGWTIVVIWSRAAARDPEITRVLDESLMKDIPKGARRIRLLPLDDEPVPALLSGIMQTADVGRLVQELSQSADRRRSYKPIARPDLAGRFGNTLANQRRLLLLAPRGGGATSMAREVLRALAPDEARVTWLHPPPLSDASEAEYFAELTGDKQVTRPLDYSRWQLSKAADRPHTVVLAHDGGPIERLNSLSIVLRGLWEEHRGQFTILAVGGARAADLRFTPMHSSLFSGMPTEHVPPLGVVEVAQLLDGDGDDRDRLALELHEATGGHPGFLHELLTGAGAITGDAGTRRLARSGIVRGAINRRLKQDDVDRRGTLHAGHVLRALVEGKAARSLIDVEDDLRYGEVRLYFDGLVRADGAGRTDLTCEAVRAAAIDALAVWEETRA